MDTSCIITVRISNLTVYSVISKLMQLFSLMILSKIDIHKVHYQLCTTWHPSKVLKLSFMVLNSMSSQLH